LLTNPAFAFRHRENKKIQGNQGTQGKQEDRETKKTQGNQETQGNKEDTGKPRDKRKTRRHGN